jgi:uncharacterized protein (DUF1697 family)
MSLYVAFLRGMNVGGHRLTNVELCAHFVAMGFSDVKSFRASGNVVFAGDERTPQEVQTHIQDGLQAELGYAVPTFIRSAAEVLAIAAMKPFTAKQLEASNGKLQVAMLASPSPARAKKEVMALGGDSDLLAFDASELYWLPSGGLLESPLDMKLIERLLGAMTMRTKGTVEQIAGKHFAAE